MNQPTDSPTSDAAPTAPGARAAAPPDNDPRNWELAQQCRRVFAGIKWLVVIGVVLGVVVVISEATRYYDLFARVHWSLGYGYIAAVVIGLILLVGVPVWRYWRIPRAMRPPNVDLTGDAVKRSDLVRRAGFVAAYVKTMQRNPELADEHEQLALVRKEAVALRRRAETCSASQLGELTVALQQFEENRVHALLKPLDAKVDAYIRREAIAVGLGTAVSLSGTIDAFIVLWRCANLVSRVSRYYYGRPGLRGSLMILRDVLVAVVVSRAMDDLTDYAGDIFGKALGSLGGVVAGPAVDGMVNAMLVMNLGYLAKRRCRTFQPWNRKNMISAMTEALRAAGGESMTVARALLSRVGRFGAHVASAARSVASAVDVGGFASGAAAHGKSAWNMVRGWFNPPPDTEGANPP